MSGHQSKRLCFGALTRYWHIKTAEQRTIQQYGDWYTGRWWVDCYIWYSEEGPGRAGALLKLGADDPYARAVRTGRTYGPDVRVCIFAPVRTARNYGPYVRVVCTDHPYAPVRPGSTSGPDGKSIVMQCFFQLRAVRTGRVHRAPVRTGRKAKSFNTV